MQGNYPLANATEMWYSKEAISGPQKNSNNLRDIIMLLS